MKVALLISGYLRTFKLNIPLIKSKILDQFDSVDVYIHITKNESKDDRYFNLTNEIEDITYINNILNPTTLIFEDPNFTQDSCRYMTQIELERCMTLPDGYTKVLNRNQAAHHIGNGWTVDVIAHIFKNML